MERSEEAGAATRCQNAPFQESFAFHECLPCRLTNALTKDAFHFAGSVVRKKDQTKSQKAATGKDVVRDDAKAPGAQNSC
jgi:hypothetical protein